MYVLTLSVLFQSFISTNQYEVNPTYSHTWNLVQKTKSNKLTKLYNLITERNILSYDTELICNWWT